MFVRMEDKLEQKADLSMSPTPLYRSASLSGLAVCHSFSYDVIFY